MNTLRCGEGHLHRNPIERLRCDGARLRARWAERQRRKARFRPLPDEERTAPPKPKGTWDWREPVSVIGWMLVGVTGIMLGGAIWLGLAVLLLMANVWGITTDHLWVSMTSILGLFAMWLVGWAYGSKTARRFLGWIKEMYAD